MHLKVSGHSTLESNGLSDIYIVILVIKSPVSCHEKIISFLTKLAPCVKIYNINHKNLAGSSGRRFRRIQWIAMISQLCPGWSTEQGHNFLY
jgi:hypothetical protein